VQPSSYTYGLLIGDLARSGTREDMARADALVKRMRLSKLTPSTVTYTALLGGYFRAGMVPQALTILKQMERDGIDMDIVTYNMILRSIVNSNVDAQVKKAVKRVGGNVGGSPAGFWRTIIDAMLARRITPNDDTWFIILSGLLRAHRFEEGDAVIEEIRRQDFRPRPASSLERCIDDIRQRKFVRPRSDNVRRTRR
jgi:pentatricopeptide repeat protein